MQSLPLVPFFKAVIGASLQTPLQVGPEKSNISAIVGLESVSGMRQQYLQFKVVFFKNKILGLMIVSDFMPH